MSEIQQQSNQEVYVANINRQMKNYRDPATGNLHWILPDAEPEAGWEEVIRDPNELPDPNYVPPYTARRQNTYPSIGDQLGMLYDDVLAGKFGESAKESQWFEAVKAVKEIHPKD